MTSTDGYFGRAEYDFAEALQNELPLSVGDVVFVTQSVDSNWSEGILVKTGTKGHFPASFVSPLAMPAKREPNESVVVAIGDFKTPERGDLHFEKGAVIVVSRVIDDNWMEGGLIGPNGRLTGTKGIFPKSFVVDVNEFSSSRRNESAKSGGEVRRVEARVIADLQAKLDDEIDLKKNEIVSVLDSSTEWCTVQTSDGRRGTCPKPFLSFETKQSASATLHQPSAPVASATPQKAAVPQYACDSLEPYGRTKFQFHAEYTGELSFAGGRIVKLLRYVDDEWLEGELDGKTGIFPVSYVDIIIDCPPSMGLSADSGYTSAREPSITSTAASSCSSTATNVSEERVALFDFAGGERDDLPVRTGDIVQVVEVVNAEWVKCRHSATGRVGLVPANFLCHRDAGTSSQDVAINWRVPPATAEMTSSAFRFSGEVPLSVSGYNRASSVRWHAPHSIDSPIAFSSSRAASPMLQPIIIPADEFVERQHQQAQQNASQQKAAPPPRPAMQPSRLSSSTLEKEKEVKEVERGERMKLAREKIAQDLVKSEMQFVTDLRACDSALRADPVDLLDKSVLLAGFPEVIDLASKLLNALQAEYGNSDADRAFGSLFLRFQADFSKVYGKYWETSDAAAGLLEKYDQDGSRKDALKACFKRMQANGCSCIDVHSAVCRPVQRLLKYPLFLGELLKCTDIRHHDHPKLLEAVKQMSNLAQSMNESKRQKDLVLKYRKEKDQTISDRLSKFNLHTMKKKGSRFSYRLTSTIGITQLERDEAFEAAENDFRATDKLVRTLLRDVRLYCDRIQHLVVQQVSLSDAWKEAFGINSYERLSSYRSAWVRCVDILLPTFFSQLNDRVKNPLEHLLKLFEGPSKLIAKRLDKLMDYVASKTASDGKAMCEQERIKKGEYEALNGQLKAELPAMVSMAQSVCRSVQEALMRAQKDFYSDLRSAFANIFTGAQPTRRGLTEKFDQSYQTAFEQLKALATVSVGSKPTLPKQRSTDQPSTTASQTAWFKSSGKSSKVRAAIDFPTMRQADSHRQSLRSKYPGDKLFVVINDAPVVDEQLDLVVYQGDVVAPLIKKDPMGNSQRWYCDNGVAKGFVATDRLRPLSERPSDVVQQRPPPPGQTATTTSTPHARPPRSVSVSLIDFSSPSLMSAGDRRSHAEDLLGLDFTPSVVAPPVFVAPLPPPIATTVVQPMSLWQTVPPRPTAPVASRPLPARLSPMPSTQPTKSLPSDPFQELWQEAKKQPIVPSRLPRPPQPTIPTRPAQYANVGLEMGVEETPARPTVYQQSTVPQQQMGSQQPTVYHQPPPDTAPPPLSKPVPVRSAPPPPLLTPSASTDIPDNVNDDADVEFYVADFDFDADDPENQLSLAEGQVVAVHAKHDQSGNVEWWLVEDEFGGVGYIPSNYLSPFSA